MIAQRGRGNFFKNNSGTGLHSLQWRLQVHSSSACFCLSKQVAGDSFRIILDCKTDRPNIVHISFAKSRGPSSMKARRWRSESSLQTSSQPFQSNHFPTLFVATRYPSRLPATAVSRPRVLLPPH